MKNKTLRALFFTFVGVCSHFLPTGHLNAIPPEYYVTDLGTAGSRSFGLGLNASGQVVGDESLAAPTHHGVRWTGAMSEVLPPIGGASSTGFGINASGQVVGQSANRAVIWNGTTPTELDSLGGTVSSAYAINSSGQVTGFSNLTGDSGRRGVLWNGTMPTALDALGGTISAENGINDSGQVSGHAYLAGNSAVHAVLWNSTTPTDLGTLGGANSAGFGINASGQIAGKSQITGSTAYHAVRWTGTEPEDLGTLGGTESFAFSINVYGDVIGMSDTEVAGVRKAFLFTEGTMFALDSLIIPGIEVSALEVGDVGGATNDLGQIAAFGVIKGETHALLLTPTPEPTCSMILLGSGLLLLARRNRNGAAKLSPTA